MAITKIQMFTTRRIEHTMITRVGVEVMEVALANPLLVAIYLSYCELCFQYCSLEDSC